MKREEVTMPSAVASTTKSERRKQGKALREKLPRTAHAEWKPRAKSQDIVKLLEESDVGRIRGLLPVKYQRMAVSPFTFFRGAAIIQARDLANAPVSGITVQACGDCHLANFGGFASPERVLVFDINDFDETFPGAWEWDIRRLGASLVLAARDQTFSKTVATEAVRAAAASYRERMSEYAEMSVLDAWYATVNATQVKEYFKNDKDMSARLARKQKQARSQNSETVVPKLTEVVNGRRMIKDSPPVIYHFEEYAKNFEKGHGKFLAQYMQSLQPDRQKLFDHYKLQDSAIKVVGVGSVGTRCYLALLLADGVDPLFLQVKEARRSVLESPRGKSRYAHQGMRVVAGQRLMQGASDIFLGWARTQNCDYYLRQFRDMKVSAEIETFRAATLIGYAKLCGWALARAHAKAGDAATLAGYLGSTDQFDKALAQYSEAYADQAERDYATFKAAIRSGRLSTDVEKSVGLDFLL
jgi:uncharacterized protein (DUF2252 family)